LKLVDDLNCNISAVGTNGDKTKRKRQLIVTGAVEPHAYQRRAERAT
jgi:hypothetical protein